MSYKKNITNNFLTQIIKLILGFTVSIIIARGLGPAGKGYVTYLTLVFGLISTQGHLGINEIGIHFQKKSNYSESEVFCSNISILSIMFIVISFIVISLRVSKVILVQYNYIYIFLGLIFVLSTFIYNCTRLFYIGNERFSELNKYYLINSFCVLAIIIFLWIFKFLNTLTYYCTTVLILVIITIRLFQKLNIRYKPQLNASLLKAEFKFGLLAFFSVLFIMLNYRVDQFIVMKILGASELGIYSVGVMLAELLFMIPSSVSAPLLGRLYNTDNYSKIDEKTLLGLTIKYTLYICVLLAIIGIFMTPLIPIIYGTAYADASSIVVILFFGIIFATIGQVGNAYFYKKEKLSTYLIFTLLAFLTNLFLDIILIPRLGIKGAAVASMFSYTVYGLIHLFYFVTSVGISLKTILILDKHELDFLVNTLFKKHKVFSRGE